MSDPLSPTWSLNAAERRHLAERPDWSDAWEDRVAEALRMLDAADATLDAMREATCATG